MYFKLLDLDGNGTIEQSVLLAFHCFLCHLMIDQSLNHLVQEIEQVVQESGKYNQKQVASPPFVCAVLLIFGQQAGEIAKLLFKELDMEGIDGGVSHEQLIIRVLHKPAVLKIFERIFS